MINTFITNNSKYDLPDQIKDTFIDLITYTLEGENYPSNLSTSIVFVNNDEIKELNKKFRNVDEVTDVLSFPQNEAFADLEENDLLGDVIISVEKAREQAADFNHSIERELCFLLVHSILHLIGYDHIDENDEKIMNKKQKAILEHFNIRKE